MEIVGKEETKQAVELEEIKPDAKTLLNNRVNAEIEYINLLSEEIAIRTKRMRVLRFFPLISVINKKAIFKLKAEMTMKIEFVNNVERIKNNIKVNDSKG